MKKYTVTLLLLFVLSLVTACSGSTVTEQPGAGGNVNQPPNGEAQAGGQMIIAVANDPVILNPNYAGDRVSLTINQALFAPLFQVDNGEKVFYLAESLELADDSLSYTMKLRNDALWHDGQPITADDVIFTIEKIVEESQNSFLRGNFIIENELIKTEKIDEHTVKFLLPKASPAFEATLLQVYPIPKHLFEKESSIEKSELNRSPIGSGPFQFREYQTGEHVTLVRNDRYFGGKPQLEFITYRIAKDTNTANLALQNGEIHVKYIDPQDVATIEATGNFDIYPYQEGRLAYININQNSSVAALKKVEVRQAIAHALQREELIQVAYTSEQYGDPAYSFVTPDGLYHTNKVTHYDYDQAKAKQLLEAAGASGAKLRFIVQSGNKPQEAVALYVQQKLGEVGVSVDIQSLDASAYLQKFISEDATDYELALTGYIMGYDPDAYRILFTSNGTSNYSHIQNKEVDQLFNNGASEVDPQKRAAIYEQLQEIIAEQAILYPIAYTKTIVAVNKKYGGIEEAKLKPVYIFEDVSKLYIK